MVRQDGKTEHGREMWPLDSRHRSVYRRTSRNIALREAMIICEMAERFAISAFALRNNSLQATNAFSSTYSHVLARMKLPSLFQTCEPAVVIQTVVHCILQNRFAGFRNRRVVCKQIGKVISLVSKSFQWLSCIQAILRKLIAPMMLHGVWQWHLGSCRSCDMLRFLGVFDEINRYN